MSGERRLEETLRGINPGRPSAALRSRVLAEARSSLGPAPALMDRLWFSRPLRLAWLGALVLLVAAELVLPGAGGIRPAGAARIEELGEEELLMLRAAGAAEVYGPRRLELLMAQAGPNSFRLPPGESGLDLLME